MSIKLLLLKSGEYVISDVKQAIDNITGMLYYQLSKPYIIYTVSEPEKIEISSNNLSYNKSMNEISVKFAPWILFTEDDTITINRDYVVSLVNPVKDIVDSYLENRK